MALESKVEHCVEERMTGTDESSKGFPWNRDQVLLEGDPLVAREHGIGLSDQPIALPHGSWNVRDLVAAILSLPCGAAEIPESLEKELLDVVRLQPSRFRSLHLLSDASDAA